MSLCAYIHWLCIHSVINFFPFPPDEFSFHSEEFSAFLWLNSRTLMPVKWIKWNWIEVNRGRGHSHLAKCAVCMIGAEWLKFLLMWCNIMTLEYTVCFTHTLTHTLDWKWNSLQWNLMVCTHEHIHLLGCFVSCLFFFLQCSVVFSFLKIYGLFSALLFVFASLTHECVFSVCLCPGPYLCGQPGHRHHQHGHFCIRGGLCWSPWRYGNTFLHLHFEK